MLFYNVCGVCGHLTFSGQGRHMQALSNFLWPSLPWCQNSHYHFYFHLLMPDLNIATLYVAVFQVINYANANRFRTILLMLLSGSLNLLTSLPFWNISIILKLMNILKLGSPTDFTTTQPAYLFDLFDLSSTSSLHSLLTSCHHCSTTNPLIFENYWSLFFDMHHFISGINSLPMCVDSSGTLLGKHIGGIYSLMGVKYVGTSSFIMCFSNYIRSVS